MSSSLETMRYRLVPSMLLAALLLSAMAGAAELSGQVKATTGEPLPARLLILNPETKASVLLYTDPAGNFKADVPEGKLRAVATHGPEWSIVEREAQGGEHIELLLTRLVDLPARGYYAADFHMHSTVSDGKQTPAEIALACQAEGVHIAALTDHDKIIQHEAWLATQNAVFLPLRGEEVTTRFGHVLSINCPSLVDPNITAPQDFLNVFRTIHEQGGFAIVAHPCALGMTYQAPDIRDYDAMEILNGNLPPHGLVFDYLQARKAWHGLLSQGLRIAAVGNSDNHDNLNGRARELIRHPEKAAQADPRLAMLSRLVDFEKTVAPWAWKGLHPGFYRTYLQLSETTPQAVHEAVKAGRGFVTNGPLILATLDNQPPGAEIAADGRETIAFSAELYGNRPLERLVVLINGKQAITMQTNAAQVQMALPVKPGDWVVAEVYGQWPEFATTNAWYVK